MKEGFQYLLYDDKLLYVMYVSDSASLVNEPEHTCQRFPVGISQQLVLRSSHLLFDYFTFSSNLLLSLFLLHQLLASCCNLYPTSMISGIL